MVLQKYLTNECYYTVTFIYQARILLHFEIGMQLNFPYFLLRSIQKMSSQVQKNTKNPTSSLHHYGLVKLLVCEELKSRKVTWEAFLAKKLLGSLEDGSLPPVGTSTNMASPRSSEEAAQFIFKRRKIHPWTKSRVSSSNSPPKFRQKHSQGKRKMHREKDLALNINPPAKRITRSMMRPKPSTPPVEVPIFYISTKSSEKGTILDIDLSQESDSPRYFTPSIHDLQEYSPPLNEVYEEISPIKPLDSPSKARVMPFCLAGEPHHSPK